MTTKLTWQEYSLSLISIKQCIVTASFMAYHHADVQGTDRSDELFAVSYLTPKEATCSEVKDDIYDLIQRGADPHILLCVQPT